LLTLLAVARRTDMRDRDATTAERRPRPEENSLAGSKAGSRWSGFLFGIGTAAFVDEVVFHQLLHWHHFYDRSTTDVGLVSDGLLHAFGWFAVVSSLFWLAALRSRRALDWRGWVGGALLGAGLFQLYDGTVQHKLMRLHQIRYSVDITPYDVTWNVIAVLLIITGIVILFVRRSGSSQT
jgi:uncharacterized membrane protein